MNITLYTFNADGIFTGAKEVDAFGAVPPGTTLAPPTLTPPHVAQWQSDSWVVLPAPPAPPAQLAPPVPQAVTMRQARLALMRDGKLATVNAAVATMPGTAGDAARIEWEFSNEVKRGQPLVSALGLTLGMTNQDLDNLFKLAATL